MRTVLILLFVLIPLVGKAQEYSLEQYLEKVERENMSIKKAQNDTKQSGEDVKMARSEYLPSIRANLGYRRDFNGSYMYVNGGDQEGTEGLPNKFPVNFKNTLNGALTLEQSIYNAPALANQKIAKLANAYMKLSQLDQTNEVMKQGTLLFYQTLYIKESLIVFEENSALAWNQFQHPLMFIQDTKLYPLQLKIRQLINGGSELMSVTAAQDVNYTESTLSAATVVFAIIPIIMVYPWLQKYFAKGAMLGSVKG